MIYLQLFISFLQIGMFSFGGGYAAMPLIQGQVVTLHHWLSMEEFTDLITISQMTPGPIAVNSATFVGIKIAGIPGAIVATFGCILPSCVIVTLLAKAVSEIPEHGNAPGDPGVFKTGSGSYDRFRRNCHSDHGFLGRTGFCFPSGYELEPGGDFCDLHGTSPEI